MITNLPYGNPLFSPPAPAAAAPAAAPAPAAPAAPPPVSSLGSVWEALLTALTKRPPDSTHSIEIAFY